MTVISLAESESQNLENSKNSLENFPIPNFIKKNLKAQSIESLFEIQIQSFQPIFDGKDFIGRARTGQGKTLAFVLPIISRLFNDDKNSRSKFPSVLVLCPVRELAKQVATVFEKTCGNRFSVCTVYGGTPYSKQQMMLKRGVDIVVGTCGRIKDLLEKQMLRLKALQYVVLDEVDEMLNIGFADDVETILSQIGNGENSEKKNKKHQVLLFSATLPKWVEKIAMKYLAQNYDQIDLVGKEKLQTSQTIEHLAICSHADSLNDVLCAFLRGALSPGDRALVFAERKALCNELVNGPLKGFSTSCRALHGDIPQNERTATLEAFRRKEFSVLVATDVAARGLSIKGLALVVQIGVPRDFETYVHRSGRTGRAGAIGKSVLLYTPRESFSVQKIERNAKIVFKRTGTPTPTLMAKKSTDKLTKFIEKIPAKILEQLEPISEEYLIENKKNLNKIFAAAILLISGDQKSFESRSMLCGSVGLFTVLIKCNHRTNINAILRMAKEIIGEKESKSVRNPTLFSDAKGAAFDLDIKFEKRIANLAKTKSHYSDETGSDISIEAAIELPRLASFSLGDNMNSNGRRTFGRSKFGTNFRNRNNGGGYRNGNYKRNSYNGKNRFGGNKRLRR